MLWTLIDGSSRPAGELAFAANVSPQSASTHLAKLVAGGLLHCEAQGRHRYFRLANAEVAAAVERLAAFSDRVRAPRLPALARAMPAEFLYARSCYDHLAGELAVRILQAMLAAQWLSETGPDFVPTTLGRQQLAAFGIDMAGVDASAASKPHRAYARSCVDLTQRRPHLSGLLGAALLTHYLQQRWLLRTPRSRVLSLSPAGQDAFRRLFGLSI
jgi:hypothetical protein